jgi:hypothetical protein
MAEVLTFEQLHHIVRSAAVCPEVVDLDEVLVLEARERVVFELEQRAEARAGLFDQALESHLPSRGHVGRPKHGGRTTAPQLILYAVATIDERAFGRWISRRGEHRLTGAADHALTKTSCVEWSSIAGGKKGQGGRRSRAVQNWSHSVAEPALM